MNRFEFRAWDKQNKRMIEAPSQFSSSLGYLMTFDGRTYIDGVYQDWIYMQYTGLMDKNHKKIFEGDILGGFFENGFIKWCDKCKAFQYYALGFCFACEGDVHWYELVEDEGTLEVIGNVYENPGLLENV
jgi:phage uncharacterized protein TIGR01671